MANGVIVKIPKGKGDRGWGGQDGIVLETYERFENMYSVQIVRADFNERKKDRLDDNMRFLLEESLFIDMDYEHLAELYDGKQLVIEDLKRKFNDH